MSDVDEVIGLLESWRDASGLQRVRVGVDAARTIGALPPARKRGLAVEVAKRIAPQLVPAIESETGDLSTEQVGAVIDLLRRADKEQLDGLVDALKSGDVLEALEIVDDAVDIVAPPVDAQELAELPELGDAGDGMLDDLPPPAAGVAAAAAVSGGRRVPRRTDERFSRPMARVVDDSDVREELEAAAAARADRWRDDSQATSSVPAYRAPAMDFGIPDATIELPDPTVAVLPPLEERLDDLPGGPRAVAVTAAEAVAPVPAQLASAAERLRSTGANPAVADILRNPDGYQRRRAAVAEIRDGVLDVADVATVMATMQRPTDRSWVAGAALDEGLLDAELLELLPLAPAARQRLLARLH